MFYTYIWAMNSDLKPQTLHMFRIIYTSRQTWPSLKKYDTKDVPNKGADDPSQTRLYLGIPFYEPRVWRMPSTPIQWR